MSSRDHELSRKVLTEVKAEDWKSLQTQLLLLSPNFKHVPCLVLLRLLLLSISLVLDSEQLLIPILLIDLVNSGQFGIVFKHINLQKAPFF